MNFRTWTRLVAAGSCLLATLTGCSSQPDGIVDDARLVAAADDADNWLSHGRTYDEQRFSPLTQIDDSTVSRLGLAWHADLDTARGQEATPLVIDGTLYVSTAWSMVKAYDAATGKLLWSFDPEVPRAKLVDLCCDAVNRGVAAYQGRIYVGTLDGRLIALDAKTGKRLWSTLTIPAGSRMSITGAPRIVKGKVIIGSAGSEYIVRGYIAAYDAASGKQVWRFHTVPGDPAKPFENAAMARAAKSWSGQWWKLGGGGTVWDAITYDPQTDLLYFGTANAEPWNPGFRSPDGGDNLYTASIVALNPDTGDYVWHFQETPEDRWDFDSNQQIIAATLPIGGKERRVLLHAPKNGFFYVLDAKTGKFLSGKPFVELNWADGLDAKGRPKIRPEARYEKGKGFMGLPGPFGAHSWHAMSFSPKTGLVYIPAQNAPSPYIPSDKDWKPSTLGFQTGLDTGRAAMPADKAVRAAAARQYTGSLIAWDPVAQKARWSIPHPGPFNGGTLATAGNLVFQGTAGGAFRAYAADTGRLLWTFPAQTGIIAAPISYAVKGEQYIAILAGWGGIWDLAAGVLAPKSGPLRNISRLLVFKLGGKNTLPAVPPDTRAILDPPAFEARNAARAAEGALLYGRNCTVCHGDAAVAGALTPDLRHSGAIGSAEAWAQIVHGGLLSDNGMVGWSPNLSPTQIESIRQYVLKRANEDKTLEQQH